MTELTPETLRGITKRMFVRYITDPDNFVGWVDAHADAWQADRAALAKVRWTVEERITHDAVWPWLKSTISETGIDDDTAQLILGDVTVWVRRKLREAYEGEETE